MKLETVRLIVAALADVTNGINAKLAGLTLDGSDARPANPTVYDDVDHRWVARRRVDDAETANITFPALVVYQIGPLRALLEETPYDHVVLRDAAIQIGFSYLTKKQDSLVVVRDALYFNRALMRWFNWFISQDPNSSTRTKNGVIVASCTEFTQDDVHQEWASVDCLATSLATLKLRESSP